MENTVKILYRGSLASCNYTCYYCPFAEKADSIENIRQDKVELEQFIAWVEKQDTTLEILFTPYGEALIHSHYQEGLLKLSDLPNVTKVVIQTNLSGNLDWISTADTKTLALWCSFHPSQVGMDEFVSKCNFLSTSHIAYSVGCVGIIEDFEAISKLRSMLMPEVYLWVNALKRDRNYYKSSDIQFLQTIDPLFNYNNRIYNTLGKVCHTGHTVFSVDGQGNMHRCHFNATRLGNIYEADFASFLKPSECENDTCHCYIGYIHLEELNLKALYGNNLLERIYLGGKVEMHKH